jgi:hypothetical protein
MRIERLHGWVLPVVLAVLMADANFFLYASIGDPADYVGVGFFALFGLYALQSLATKPEPGMFAKLLGSVAAMGLLILSVNEIFDWGDILPYGVFIGFVLVGHVLDRALARRRPGP